MDAKVATEHLKAEIATYQQHRSRLVAEAEGKYVLIHDSDVVGTYDTYEDALNTGYKQFGLGPFMVQQIRSVDDIQYLNNGSHRSVRVSI
jgi:hypothetical protein